MNEVTIEASDGRIGSVDGVHALPILPSLTQIAAQRAAAEPDSVDPAAHLRSASEVERYLVRALDGNLGDVESLLFDDVNWAIRYLVVNTSNWCFGRHVAVAPEWITGICWRDRSLSMNVTRQRLKTAPPYDGAAHVDREWEADYYQHLQQPGYWLTETQARAITDAPTAYRQDDASRRNESASAERSRVERHAPGGRVSGSLAVLIPTV